jgi:hypothetical protein
MGRLALAAGALFLLSGCFLFEELDKAEKLMDAHTRAGRTRRAAAEAPAEAGPAPAPDAGPGILERVGGWWETATTPAPPPEDPNNVLVRCAMGGSTRFTRRFDCQSQGGRVVEALPPAAAQTPGESASH